MEKKNNYEFAVKIRNVVYDQEPFQQAVLEKITIWALHEIRDNSFGASELLQKDHQRATIR